MKKRNCIIPVAKTKVLISCAVTAQLICVFVFAYVIIRFSHVAAQFMLNVCIMSGKEEIIRLFPGSINFSVSFEPPRGKTNNVVSEQFRHKPACTVTEKS